MRSDGPQIMAALMSAATSRSTRKRQPAKLKLLQMQASGDSWRLKPVRLPVVSSGSARGSGRRRPSGRSSAPPHKASYSVMRITTLKPPTMSRRKRTGARRILPKQVFKEVDLLDDVRVQVVPLQRQPSA